MKVLRRVAQTLASQHGGATRVAISFSVGVFCGFSPLVGLHTITGLAAAVLFRLNKVAVLLGVYLNNPWVLIPYYALATWVGVLITGLPGGVELSQYGLSDILSRDFWFWVLAQWRLLVPAIVGSTLLSVLFALAAYPLCVYAIRRFGATPASDVQGIKN